MRTSLVLAIALLALRPALAEDAEKTWTLDSKWKPVAGTKMQVKVEKTAHNKLKMSTGGQVVKDDDTETSSSFEFLSEITAVSGDDVTGATYKFEEATHTEDGEEASYGFEGKTVVGKKDGKEWTYAYSDGTPVAEEDLKGLEDAVDNKSSGEDDVEDVFKPKKPVKVGESWDINMEAAAKSFGDDGVILDPDSSEGTCTLKSVETKDGAPFGTVTLEMDLGMSFPPPVTLEKPLSFKATGEVRSFMDGSHADGGMKMTFNMGGKRKGTVAQKGKQPVAIELEMESKGTMSRSGKTVK